jgi:hypothetical protein
VAAILAGHRPFLATNLPIILVWGGGLALRQLTFLHLVVTAGVLTLESIVDLVAPRVGLFPVCLGEGAGGDDAAEQRSNA